MNSTAKVSQWFKDRCGSDLVDQLIAQKTVPLQGLSLKHYLGGAILFLLACRC